jgi:Dolichyl-phosphate-mannose-protein mannosyltransferase
MTAFKPIYWVGILFIAVLLDVLLILWSRHSLGHLGSKTSQGRDGVFLGGKFFPTLTWIRKVGLNILAFFAVVATKITHWLIIPNAAATVAERNLIDSRKKGNLLLAWKQRQPKVLLIGISLLAFMPAYLIFLNRWSDDNDLLFALNSLWCRSTFLCETTLPGFFLLIFACLFGLLVFVWLKDRNGSKQLSLNLSFRKGNLDSSSRLIRWKLNLSVILLGASLLAALTSFVIGLGTDTVPGIGFLLAFMLFAAGWLVLDVPFQRRAILKGMDRQALLAFLLMHVALLIFLSSFYRPAGLTWGPAILLLLSILNLAPYTRKIPWILWFVTLAVIFFTIDINHWAFSIIGDEYSFYTYALEVAERHNILRIAQHLFDGNAVYGAHPYFSSLIQAVSMLLFGENNFGWRFSSLYLSAWSIGLFFLFFRHFIGRFQALLACALLTGSAYLMSFGKIGYNNLQALFAMALVMAVAGWAVRSRRWISAVSLGFSMGFCFYVYPAALYILPLPVLLMLFYDFPDNSRAIMRWVITFLTFGYSLFPVLLQPNYWQSKMAGLFTNNPQIVNNSTNLVQHTLSNLLLAFSSYLYIPSESHYVVSAYMDPLSGAFVSLGLALCLINSRKEKFIQFFLTGLLALLILVGATHDRRFPPTTRMFLLLPWFAVLATFGMNWLVKQYRSVFEFHLKHANLFAVGIILIYGLNLYQAYPLSIARSAGLQSFEVLFLRLTQHIEQHDRGQVLLPHTILFLMDSHLNLDGFNMVQEVYQIPETSIHLQRVQLDGPVIPNDAFSWVNDQNSLVVLQPTLDKNWYEAVGNSLEASGRHVCDVDAEDGQTRFQFFYLDQMSWTCEKN